MHNNDAAPQMGFPGEHRFYSGAQTSPCTGGKEALERLVVELSSVILQDPPERARAVSLGLLEAHFRDHGELELADTLAVLTER